MIGNLAELFDRQPAYRFFTRLPLLSVLRDSYAAARRASLSFFHSSPTSHCLRDSYAAARRGIPAGVSLASRRASHFLLRGQEKVTQEKATPMQRSPGIRQLLLRCSTPASMPSPALRLRNATPGVRRQPIHGLTANWAQSIAPTLRAIPTSRCRCKGGPVTGILPSQDEADSRTP